MNKSIAKISHSFTGKEIFTFLVFVCVSSFFWLLMTLNDRVQRNYDVPVEIVDMPEGVVIDAGYNEMVNVTIRGKGIELIKYEFGGDLSPMEVEYIKCRRRGDGHIIVDKAQTNEMLRSYFGHDIQVVSVTPDSITVNY